MKGRFRSRNHPQRICQRLSHSRCVCNSSAFRMKRGRVSCSSVMTNCPAMYLRPAMATRDMVLFEEKLNRT